MLLNFSKSASLKNPVGFFLLFILIFTSATAQQNNDPDSSARASLSSPSFNPQPLRAPKDADVDFLFSYYDQDGNHSAVTGGIGTEKLADKASRVIVNVPLDSSTRFLFNSAINHYTSASTDNINRVHSSASSEDMRWFVAAGIRKENSKKRIAMEIMLGGSTESDYMSLTPSYSILHWSKNRSNTVSASAQLFFDQWMPVFPEELRNTDHANIPDVSRRSLNLAFTGSRAFTKKIQGALSFEFVMQNGLLSTPFHRVYFLGDSLPWVEKLPVWRVKTPVSLRLNFFVTDFLVLRGWYRFYADNFGIRSHSFNLEIPVKIGNYFSLTPFYRFHTQSASKYFVEHTTVTFGQEYYSSDYDLSALRSQKFGIGLQFSPLYGIGRWKMLRKLFMLRQMDARGAYYLRSDGLKAWMVSLGFSFRIKNR